MQKFIQKHSDSVIGILSGFDRLRFRGTLRLLANTRGLWNALQMLGVLLKDFKKYSLEVTAQLRQASEQVAREQGRMVHYMNNSQESKEDFALAVAASQGIREGLICVIGAVELCRSFRVQGNRETQRLELVYRPTKCTHLYHYSIHPEFGLMYVRLQTWFPFTMFIGINGREWLSRQLDREGISYVRADNCFLRVSELERAQALLREQVCWNWPESLEQIRRQVHPAHDAIFKRFPQQYYWSVEASEWATDVMFKDVPALSRLYPQLVRFAMENLKSPDILRFLGRKLPAQAEVTSDFKHRLEGIRVKHSINFNSEKMYDKFGSILRTEATINNTRELRVPHVGKGGRLRWKHMAKGVQDLYYRVQASQAANERYLDALAASDSTIPLGKLIEPLCQAKKWKGKRCRALRPLEASDSQLLDAVSRGEFLINGFRNRDLVAQLFGPSDTRTARQKQAAVSRQIRLLRAHGLIQRIPRSYRYRVSTKGRRAISTLQSARAATIAQLMKAA